MREFSKRFVLTVIIALLAVATVNAQFYKTLRGTPDERKKNNHSGNQIRTTFYNYGFVGRLINDPEDIGGEWPINSGHEYVGDISVMVGAEVELPNGEIIRPVTVADGPRGSNEYNPNDPNDFWGWEPIPGFSNPESDSVAMSHIPESWPPRWPDKEVFALPDGSILGDPSDPGWPGQWNGFFGKDQFNADQESYWWMDDSRDREFILTNNPFYPDSTDMTRGGLGLVASVRGLQWSQTLAQNTLFWLYEVTNVGTTDYDKTVFGMIVGTLIGGDGDSNDDNSKFDTEQDLTYSWDNDNIGAGGWSPVGMMGYAFLESPGNRLNGFDDDNDGADGPGDVIDESMLQARVAQVGDTIILIDYFSENFERTKTVLPAEGVTIQYNSKSFTIMPGDTLFEKPYNNIDDNLNGLIDENTEIPNDGLDNNGNGLIDEKNPHLGLKYHNYFTGLGANNTMLDEGRDDLIDNDGDWNPATDDVGRDGKPNTFDEGEGDGQPTSGFKLDPVTGLIIDTGLPGEPNIDKTDIDESDQIGLTSFYFFQPSNVVRLREDAQLWRALRPGFFDDEVVSNVDGDFIYGTGYFPLRSGQTERISLAFFFAEWKGTLNSSLPELVRTKETVQIIYNNDYNFAKAPLLPKLKAAAGDNKVILYWDSKAEESFDRLSLTATGNGYDFEGYKIYRATFPSFDETGVVTNAFGSRVGDVPIAQFDLDNDQSGFFPAVDPSLGSVFYLGDNTGLVHTYVDTTVKNGFTYFYAVTAYDRGINTAERVLQPSETSKFASISASGRIDLGQNVVVVRPEAPVAGYLGPEVIELTHAEGDGTGDVLVEPIDPLAIQDGHTYEVSFGDTLLPPASITGNTSWRQTTDFTVVDVTTGDTLVANSPYLEIDATVFDGIKLHILNDRVQPQLSKVHWADSTRDIVMPDAWTRLAEGFAQGKSYPANYQVEVVENAQGDSIAGIPLFGFPPLNQIPTNIRVKNVSENRYVKFNLYDLPGGDTKGVFDEQDILVIFEYDNVHTNNYVPTYLLKMAKDATSETPVAGDVLSLPVRKPFMSYDKFRFTAKSPSVSRQKAKSELDRIKVVPNPYVATAIWEPRNNFSNGRGDRSIHFIHLPQECTIRIFNVRGELVQTIHHKSLVTDGTADWNLLTRDNLEVAYGVYIYHIDAPGIGQTTGKFAIIK
ncbi:MAG: hypothetical protein Kow0037_02220 [Calditrichia bacterium]